MSRDGRSQYISRLYFIKRNELVKVFLFVSIPLSRGSTIDEKVEMKLYYKVILYARECSPTVYIRLKERESKLKARPFPKSRSAAAPSIHIASMPAINLRSSDYIRDGENCVNLMENKHNRKMKCILCQFDTHNMENKLTQKQF